MQRVFIFLLALLVNPALEAGWNFDKKIAVAPFDGKNVYPHLDASGRKNIAISGNYIGVVWEDNRSGTPQAYAAFKKLDNEQFSKPVRISSGSNAYEPTIVSIGGGNFAAGWEQDGGIWLCQLDPQRIGVAAQIDRTPGSHVSLAHKENNVVIAAWSSKRGRYARIVTSLIALGNNKITAGKLIVADSEAPAQNQIYPNINYANGLVMVVWEDRRRGHTMFMYASAKPGKPFSPPRIMNEFLQKSQKYGRGSGVTRVSLASYGKNNVAAAWMDKRNFSSGYDVYAAFSSDAGIQFGSNQKVQDDFAENIAQWHPAIAANAKNQIVIAWDDNRDDSQDVWLSWKTADGWSQDSVIAPASGEGAQSSPAIALDDSGGLHVIWIDRESNGIARIYYSKGRQADD